MIYSGIDIWERLAETTSPIVLYGTGDGADKVLDELARIGVSAAGVFASDGFVRRREFRGMRVLSFAEAESLFPDMTVLMCFGSARPEVLANVRKIESRHPFFAPDAPVCGDEFFNRAFFDAHRAELEAVRDMLSDDLSRRTFDDIVSFKLSGDVAYLRDCETEESDFGILGLPGKTVFLDLGAFTGDTAAGFACACPDYSRIIAVEPDRANYAKLVRNAGGMRDTECVRAFVSDAEGFARARRQGGRGARMRDSGETVPVVTMDGLLSGIGGSIYIKADVEGAELAALRGAAHTLTERTPYMKTDCYHRSEDLFTLPLFVRSLGCRYRVFMRHRPYIPAWETAYYFVPEK